MKEIKLLINLFILLSLFYVPVNLNACIWYKGHNLHGDVIRLGKGSDTGSSLRRRSKQAKIEDLVNNLNLKDRIEISKDVSIKEFLLQIENDKSIEPLAKGISYLLSNKPEKAIKILLEESKIKGDAYEISANLAVAFELSGDLQKSIEWQEKALKIDPDSHGGTDWLHLLLLEIKLAKLNKLKNINFKSILKSNKQDKIDGSIKSVNFPISKRIKNVSNNDIYFAIDYQLSERLFFIKEKDDEVSELFNIISYYEFNSKLAEESLILKELSKHYATTATPELDKDISSLKRFVLWSKFKNLITFKWFFPKDSELNSQREF